jgi:hypothetical protein
MFKEEIRKAYLASIENDISMAEDFADNPNFDNFLSLGGHNIYQLFSPIRNHEECGGDFHDHCKLFSSIVWNLEDDGQLDLCHLSFEWEWERHGGSKKFVDEFFFFVENYNNQVATKEGLLDFIVLPGTPWVSKPLTILDCGMSIADWGTIAFLADLYSKEKKFGNLPEMKFDNMLVTWEEKLKRNHDIIEQRKTTNNAITGFIKNQPGYRSLMV